MDQIEEERKKFEAAGTALHRWDHLDYRRCLSNGKPEYEWTTQRQAFALWLAAKGITS